MRILFVWFIMLPFPGCRGRNNQPRTDAGTETTKPASNAAVSYAFESGDSVRVVLQKDPSDPLNCQFTARIAGRKFAGKAALERIEDNGKFYLPEVRPVIDETTGEAYRCDSTFSYDERDINLAFAMENLTGKRLSFAVNNSSVKGVEDAFYTLYRK